MSVNSYLRWRWRRTRQAFAGARAVDAHAAYLLRELGQRRETADYTMRGKRLRVTHRTEDTAIFREVFVEGFYEFPGGWLREPPRRILDLGSNIGMFELLATSRWPTAEVIAFEPDPANAARCRWTMQANGMPGRVIQACAGTYDGTVNFVAGRESMSHISGSEAGDPTPIVDVFAYLGNADILKMDIEGGEWSIMLDSRFQSIGSQVVLMEYHPHLCPEPDARGLAERTLREAGYEVVLRAHDPSNGVGVLHGRRR